MSQVSRPVLIALIAAVAFAGVWFTALRPKTDGSRSATPAAHSAPGVTGLKRAIGKAHGAVGQANRSSAHAAGAPTAAAPRSPATPATRAPAAPAPARRAPVKPAAPALPPPTSRRDAVVQAALAANKVVAIGFFNPASTDDLAVAKTLKGADTHGGRVLLMSANIADVAQFGSVTSKAGVFGSPTVIIIDRKGEAGAITGFADQIELNQRIDDALGPDARKTARRGSAQKHAAKRAPRAHHSR
jgi:hypothetical protein